MITENKTCGNKSTYIMYAVLLLIPLCWIKHLKHLAYVSLVILAGMLFTYSVLIYISGTMIFEGNHKFEEIKMFDIWNYPFFFGIALLNYEGNPVCLNIRSSMKNPKKFINLYTISIFIVMIVS
mmetsp:Transcript_10261/g.9066  ORF Transcript_10261/g.9066 Transcript_10261/m.9066 type:complete len:124 (+) Transcript_10261:471-842(+)